MGIRHAILAPSARGPSHGSRLRAARLLRGSVLCGSAPFGLALLGLAAAGPAAAAPFFVSGPGAAPQCATADPLSLCTSAMGFGGPVFSSELGFPSGAGSDSQSDAGTQASGAAAVSSSLGTADFELSGHKSGTTSFGFADVSARAHWADSVTLDAPGLTGQAGTLRASFVLSQESLHDGVLASALSMSSIAGYTATVLVDGAGWRFTGSTGFSETRTTGREDETAGDPPGVMVTGDLSFVFGTPFDLDVETVIAVDAGVNGPSGTALASTEAGMGWLGLTEVRRASDAALVTDYALSSASGVDWSLSQVPEPATALLLGAGLAALARRQRGRCGPGAGCRAAR